MNQTPLHEWHIAHAARMVDFAGWSMPVLYAGIVAEHHAVRRAAGLFDISHMGRLSLSGGETVAFMDHLVTCPVGSLKPGRIRYGLVANDLGGILDDVLVYRIDDRTMDLVVNASNREKIMEWIQDRRGEQDVNLLDQTFETAMLALQGPRAAERLAPYVASEVINLRYYRFLDTTVFGVPARVSRTGYTGEDGFEFIVPADAAVSIADRLLALASAEADLPVHPCGLGCRDTLRLEAGMPLYGHELTETIDPITAGLAFAVGKSKTFIGSDEIAATRAAGPKQTRVGLCLEGRRIAREGTPVLADGKQIGTVTSGTLSPTLEASIAMAYVDTDLAAPGTRLEVDLKGKLIPATLIELPFYRRSGANH